ncbi:type II secretion system protein [Neobacillus sp. OS1-2]|uniref:type II secretion system protein n=1 Tax=Neobacillus sp. OS1-2 TaxID=3070680 RepID=UPI0027DFC67D|nr:type II secretion system protein [Neobacillus sp. OS1-2]WML40714.1 type II secretion system protein [Neobacillus sp. OS1-2]
MMRIKTRKHVASKLKGKNNFLNEDGLTLLELLAVIVILGIISTIAFISISRVIQDSKDRAFVGNAFALKEAASLFLREESVNEKAPREMITYQELVEADYLDEFKDPDTGEYLQASSDSFVLVNGSSITAVCLKGQTRNLCSYSGDDSAIPIKDLTATRIKPNN